MQQTLLLVGIVLLVAGCSSGIQPAGPDTYIITRRVSAFSTGASAKAEAYREASEWCAKRGLVMVPVESDAKDPGFGRFGSSELLFRALKPGDPDIKRVNVESPNHVERIQSR
jgi:hypothetical protein